VYDFLEDDDRLLRTGSLVDGVGIVEGDRLRVLERFLVDGGRLRVLESFLVDVGRLGNQRDARLLSVVLKRLRAVHCSRRLCGYVGGRGCRWWWWWWMSRWFVLFLLVEICGMGLERDNERLWAGTAL
jgi:hypothetical protein